MSTAKLDVAGDGPFPYEVASAKPNAEKNVTKDKRRDIQGLRGIAIIYVLLFHLNPKFLPRGFLGVDIFFVISGFLITMILVRCKPLRLTYIVSFFSKRVRRIFPAYYVMMATVLIFAYFILIDEDYYILKTEAKWAWSFASNIQKCIQNNDYFAEVGNFDFLLHTWSLAAEIQFYLVAPLFVGIMQLGKAGNVFNCVVLASSLAFNCWTTGPLHFSSLPSRIWQFACGGIAYKLQTKSNSKVLIFLVCLLISPVFLFAPIPETPARITITVASSVIVALNDNYANQYILGNSILFFIGEISYSLYLAHWPIITFARYFGSADVLLWKDAVLAVEISVALSIISYKTIEKFFIGKGIMASAVLIGTLYSATLVLTFDGTSTAETASKLTQKVANQTAIATNEIREQSTRFESFCYEFNTVPYLPANITEEVRRRAVVKNKEFLNYKLIANSWKYNLTDPVVQKHFKDTKTHIDFPDFLKGNGTISAAVFGNSYSWKALPAIIEAFDNRLKEIRLLAAAGCMSFEKTAAKAEGKYKKYCNPFFDKSLLVLNETRPDVIFMINRPMWEVMDKFESLGTDQTFQSMQRTIDQLSNLTKRIILQLPLPMIYNKFYTNLLLKALQKKTSLSDVYIPYSEFWGRYQYAYERMKNLRCSKCTWISPHHIFCDAKVCRVFDPENLYSFFDHNVHYNPYAGKCLKRLYKDTIDELVSRGYI